jgi:hypothetical protein
MKNKKEVDDLLEERAILDQVSFTSLSLYYYLVTRVCSFRVL